MQSNKLKIIVSTILLLSIALFVAGLSFPLISTKKQILGITLQFEKIWLFTSIKFFYQEKEYFLTFIILFFTFLFPIVKYFNLRDKVFQFFYPKQKSITYIINKQQVERLRCFSCGFIVIQLQNGFSNSGFEATYRNLFRATSILLRMGVNMILNGMNKQIWI